MDIELNGMVPVILCGGSGTRLWPLSRANLPKPFLPLLGEQTLFQCALSRCPEEAGFSSPLIVTGSAHLPHVEEQLGERSSSSIIVEPTAKNTAAAIALAALRLPEDALMLVCPADHHIGNVPAFIEAAKVAAGLASEGWLVSFGIEADRPETGYGYLKRGEEIAEGAWRVARFVEKPSLERAEDFIADGGYAWNGGIFAFQAGAYLAQLEAHRPAIAAAVRKSVADGTVDDRRFHPNAAAFVAIQGESIDYAVMENTGRAAMVAADMDWSDIGNWQALQEARVKDAFGNSIVGPAELIDCRNVAVDSDGPRVSVIGLDGVVIVVNGNEVLVTTAVGAQHVGKLEGARGK